MHNINRIINITCSLIFFMSLLVTTSDCPAKTDQIYWNDKAIKWQGYNDGIAKAKRNRKPAIIVFYANWCPTCKKYGAIFKNKKIIKAASDFVMIRVNMDTHSKLSSDYGFDGEYVPRTFAVYPDGKVMHQIYSPKKYKYYIGLDAGSLLSLMQKARSHI